MNIGLPMSPHLTAIRITWRVFKLDKFLSSTVDQLNQSFRGWCDGPGDRNKQQGSRITILAELRPYGDRKLEGIWTPNRSVSKDARSSSF